MNILSVMRKETHYSLEEVAKYLAVNVTQYEEYEQVNIMQLPYSVIEKIAALYHVSEYEILTEKAEAHSLTGNVHQEVEIIPSMTIVENYLMMSRLLDGAQAGNPHYQIALNNKNHQCHSLS